MKYTVSKCIKYIFPVIAFFLPVLSYSEAVSVIETGNGPIEIQSKYFEADIKNNTITFFEDVEAVTEDLKFNSQKLVIFLNRSQTGEDPGNARPMFDRIEATEQVKITRADGSLATAEKAVYHIDKKKIILTGDPFLKMIQKDSILETACPLLTLNLIDGLYSCEGSEEKRARAVFFPSGKETE